MRWRIGRESFRYPFFLGYKSPNIMCRPTIFPDTSINYSLAVGAKTNYGNAFIINLAI